MKYEWMMRNIKQSSVFYAHSSIFLLSFLYYYLFLSLNVCHMTNWRILGSNGEASHPAVYQEQTNRFKSTETVWLQTKSATQAILPTNLSIDSIRTHTHTQYFFFIVDFVLCSIQFTSICFEHSRTPYLPILQCFLHAHNFHDGFCVFFRYTLH